MERIVFIAAGAAALISGCASTRNVADYDNGVDYRKVALINSIARARGVEVHWLTYPQRRSTPADVVPSLGEPSGT